MRDILSFMEQMTARRLVLPGTGFGLRIASQDRWNAALLALARLSAWPSTAGGDDEAGDGLSCSLESVGYYEASRAPFFETAAACAEVTQVFSRWGVTLDDYFGSLEEFFGAWLVLCGHAANLARKLVARGQATLTGPYPEPLDLEYLQAVLGGNRARAAALFRDSSFFTLVEREISAARLDLESRTGAGPLAP